MMIELPTVKFAIVLVGSLLIAVLGARPYAEGWNDGSRLASVESLIDHHTWAIDDSIFVKVPSDTRSYPYDPAVPTVTGTMDRVFINGHYYSDKPPAATLYLAGIYWIAQRLTGVTAARNPHVFIYLLTVASAGLSYIVAVICIWLIAQRLGFSENFKFMITCSFGLATIAVVYSRQVNTHIMQLALVGFILLIISSDRRRPVLLGAITGAAYTLDLGIGMVLIASILTYVWVKWNALAAWARCLLSTLPFIALHHLLNYELGGTLLPINMHPEYFDYPGSPFGAGTLTGVWNHHSIWTFVIYAIKLLVGPRGFILYNLPLLVIPIAAARVWNNFPQWRAEILFMVGFSAGSWLLYAAGSTNYSGLCCSVRWFVPLLMPAFFVLCLALKVWPPVSHHFLLVSTCGFILTVLLFWTGPWAHISLLPFWLIVLSALFLLVLTCFHKDGVIAKARPSGA